MSVITISLLSIINAIGAGPTMWIYAAFNVGAWVFVWLRLPELTGRSLEDVERRLREHRFRPADFRRPAADPYPSGTAEGRSRPAPLSVREG